MASFYANENFPRRTVEALRALGHDVLTTQEAGIAGQAIPDHDVLDFATRAGRAVLTLNRRDFIRLHRHDLVHAASSCAPRIPTPQLRPDESTSL